MYPAACIPGADSCAGTAPPWSNPFESALGNTPTDETCARECRRGCDTGKMPVNECRRGCDTGKMPVNECRRGDAIPVQYG